MLERVISGGQSGADIAGLEIAKKFGLKTGGWMPFGYKTLDGPKAEYREMYGVTMDMSSSYVPRTKMNVKVSDGTIYLAFDLESKGAICTNKAIIYYKKPSICVNLNKTQDYNNIIGWIKNNNIVTLNVAGNSEKTYPGTHKAASLFLTKLFEEMKL